MESPNCGHDDWLAVTSKWSEWLHGNADLERVVNRVIANHDIHPADGRSVRK
jgi:hypothetical protein